MVNEQIYGLKATWRTDNFSPNIDDNLKHYSANFGNNNGQILYAIRNNKLKVNTPWDKSISYAAMDNGSVYSKITFCSSNGTEAPNVLTTENNPYTEFNIGITNRNPNTNKQYNISKDKSYYTSMFWATNSTAVEGTSTDREFRPSTSIAFKNMVLVPFVLATASNTPPISDNDKICVALKEYIDTYTLTHPYIVRVIVAPYGYPAAYTYRTNIATGIPTIAILNQLPKLGAKLNEINGSTPDVLPFYTYTMCRGFIGGGSGLRNVARGINLFGECQTDTDVDIWGYSTNAYLDTDTGSNHYMSAWLNYDKYVHVKNEAYPKKIFSYIPYYNDFYDDVMKQTAYFGLFFTPDLDVAEHGGLTNTEMYCGIIDDAGMTHGTYYHGNQNELLKQYSGWESTNDTPYKPGGGGDAETKLHRRTTLGDTSGYWYALPDNGLAPFKTIMQKINDTDAIENANFYGQNPVDCIVEAKELYLSNLSELWQNADSINFGDYAIPISGNQSLSGTLISGFTFPSNYICGDITIPGRYGDYRDYEPYTSAVLVVPFCGMAELEPSVIIGNHAIRLEETIDEFSGDIVANLLVDNCLYRTLTGNCASDIAITGVEASTYALARKEYLRKGVFEIFEGMQGLIGGISGSSIAASYKNKMGTVSQAFGGLMNFTKDLIGGIMDMRTYQHLHPSPVRLSTGSPNPQSNAITYPYIFVQSPIDMLSESELETFKKLNGFAVYKTGKLSDSSGMTVCSDYNFDGLALTKAELDMLAELLEGGVII